MHNIHIFSKKGESFLKNEMCVCLDDLTNKILTDAPEKKNFFKDLIDYFLTLEFPHNYNDELDNFQGIYNSDFIQIQLSIFSKKNILEDNSNAMIIYNELNHALDCYVSIGLEGLYTNRSAECWYPKIIIKRIIGDKINIDSLDNIITIYRGTSESEFDSELFGQSWSIDKTQAENFAFVHYRGQDTYVDTIRVVLKATINKKDIFYYRKFHEEKEIIINQSKLINNTIEIIKKRKLINYTK